MCCHFPEAAPSASGRGQKERSSLVRSNCIRDTQIHLLLPPSATREGPPPPLALHALCKDRAGHHIHRDCLPLYISILCNCLHPALLQHICQLRIYPLMSHQARARLIPLCHSVGSAKVKALQTGQCHWREDPRFSAIEQHGLNYGLVEFCRNARGDILTPQHLPDRSPQFASFSSSSFFLAGCCHHSPLPPPPQPPRARWGGGPRRTPMNSTGS